MTDIPTNDSVLYKLGHIESSLDLIHKSLDELRRSMERDRDENNKKVDKLEAEAKIELERLTTRVSWLEKKQWWLTGLGASVVFAIVQLKDYVFPHA